MTKLEFIREKCIEANPSILKLKFGCLLVDIWGNYHEEIITHRDGKIIHCASGSWGTTDGILDYKDHQRLVVNGRALKILGRPILLADVLMAFGKTEIANKIGIDAQGLFERVPLYEDRGTKRAYWDLTKNLEDQSEECINFLAEILGYKE